MHSLQMLGADSAYPNRCAPVLFHLKGLDWRWRLWCTMRHRTLFNYLMHFYIKPMTSFRSSMAAAYQVLEETSALCVCVIFVCCLIYMVALLFASCWESQSGRLMRPRGWSILCEWSSDCSLRGVDAPTGTICRYVYDACTHGPLAQMLSRYNGAAHGGCVLGVELPSTSLTSSTFSFRSQR